MSPFIGLVNVLFHRDGTLDEAALAILRRAVKRAARRAGRPREEWDDLLQDLLVKLLKRHAAGGERRVEEVYDEHKLFCSCVRVAENHLIDQLRRTGRSQVEDPSVLDTRPGAGQVAADEDEYELARFLLGPGPENETPEVRVVRRLYHGETVAGIARALKMTTRNVRRLRSLGFEQLRERFNLDTADHPD